MSKSSISVQLLMIVTIRLQRSDDEDIPFEGWVDMRIKIGQNDRSTDIDLLFLVRPHELKKILTLVSMQLKFFCKSILQTAFDNIDKLKMKSFVELIE